ncbi:MAG: hypothetical protein ACP5HS_12375 [Anaerolineae bacterium]
MNGENHTGSRLNQPSEAHRASRSRHRLAPWTLSLVALAMLLVALVPAIQPLLGRALTCGYDNVFHLWRAVQIGHLWDQGVLYSRWAPDMAHGFGFPLFLFASPFPPSLVAALERLGLGWPVALNAVFILGVILGGILMYWLVLSLVSERAEIPDYVGQGAGLVAALAYIYAPFQAYDVFYRGSLWEAFAWAFPPLVLLSLHRWSRRGDRGFLVLGVLAFALMVLSHHLFAFLFGPIFAVWTVAQALVLRRVSVVGRGALLGLLGLGVTAFFWLPPLMERPFVQTDRLLGTWVFDYRYNFLSLGEVLALPRRADPLLINDWPPKALGLVPVIVAALPLIGLRRLPRGVRWRAVTLSGLLLVFVLLTLPISGWVWDHVPLLAYVQFPWRYLGPAAFCLAILAGHAVPVLASLPDSPKKPGGDQPGTWSRVGVPLLLAFVLVYASLGWFFPSRCTPVVEPSVQGMIAWEKATDTLGTTAKGEYLPIWVRDFPDDSLFDAYESGGPVSRFSVESLPEGAVIENAAYGALDAEITLTSPTEFQARYLAFYYPGWRVWIDGEEVPVRPEAETGIITFGVPAGWHVVTVRFVETPLRLVGDGLSLVSLLVLGLALVVRAPNQRGTVDPASRGVVAAEPRRQDAWLQALLFVGVVALVVGKLVLGDVLGALWRSSRMTPEGDISGLAVPVAANFGNQALLLGLDPLPRAVPADASPVLTLYWRSLEPEPRDWQVGLSLVAPDGTVWQAGLRPARYARTPPPLPEWPKEGYARMDLHVDLPPGMPPGAYAVKLALFDRATAKPASVLDTGGNPVGPDLVLGQVEVERPGALPSLEALGVGDSAQALSCGSISLWDFEINRERAIPGDLLRIRMVWEATADPEQDLQPTLALRDASGVELRSWQVAPVAAWWPTSAWQAGDRWTGRAEVRLPGSTPSGTYTLALELPGCAGPTRSLEVVAPDRRWEIPDGYETLDQAFSGLIRLVGYRLESETVSPGETVDLALAWRAEAEITEPYLVFVHLLTERGDIIKQNDGEPASWSRPTTSWAPGEVVVDPRPLSVPQDAVAGRYRVRVGLYGQDGVRLTLPSGEDGFVIAEVMVGP